jgi:hypothetical protein
MAEQAYKLITHKKNGGKAGPVPKIKVQKMNSAQKK